MNEKLYNYLRKRKEEFSKKGLDVLDYRKPIITGSLIDRITGKTEKNFLVVMDKLIEHNMFFLDSLTKLDTLNRNGLFDNKPKKRKGKC